MTRPEADDLFREYARSRDHAVMARLVEEMRGAPMKSKRKASWSAK